MGALLALGATTSPARADPESDAKDLFERGRELRTKGDCAGATPLFRKAYGLYPKGLGSLRNIAECEEQLGHFASSRRAWLDLKRALIAPSAPDPKYDGWERDAQDAAARLQPKVATVTVDVIVRTPEGEGPANEKSGVELLVNGESLGTTLAGTPLERDPGTYAVRVQAADAKPVEQQITLAAGDNKRVQLRLVRTPKSREGNETAAGPGVVEPPPAAPEDHATRRTVGWVLTGVGGAAIVGGVVTLILRGSAESDLDSACGGDPSRCVTTDPGKVSSIHDRGVTMSTLTSILLPVGAVAVGGGLALVLTTGGRRAPSSSSARVVLAPGPGGATLAGTF